MSSGIYRISFGFSKRYIGSATDLARRKSEHLSLLRRGKSPCRKLQLAYNKYGEDNFDFRVIHYCSKTELRTLESDYIKAFDSVDNGYNICYDTSIPMLGRKHSDKTKKLMAMKAKGNKGRTGQSLTPEHVELMRNTRKGLLVGISNNKGLKNASCKLSEKQVEGIRKALENKVSQSSIAESYGISQQQVSRINTGKRWK